MKIAVFALLAGICGLALAVPYKTTQYGVGKVADKVFLEYQKNILRLLMHVHQPNSFVDQVQIGKTWSIESNLPLYTNPLAIKEFVQLYRMGFLPRGEVFSIMDEVQRRQVISLFHVFYYAKSFDTFYKTACWARDYVNEGMFVYALTVAVLHRPDCMGMVLPAPYEIYPHFFVNNEVINKAKEYKMQNFAWMRKYYSGDKFVGDKYMTDKYMGDKYMGDEFISQKYMDNKYMGGKYMGDHYMGDKYMGDKYMGDKYMGEKYTGGKYVHDDTYNWMNTKEEKQRMMWEMMHGHNSEDMSHYMPAHLDMVHDMHKDIVMTGKTVDGIDVVVIPCNYTGWYLNVDQDQKLSYFTEDIGLNSYYYYFHADYPFWMGGNEFGLMKDHRGEQYFYVHQQLLARYYLERLSNGLGKIDLVDFQKHIMTSYVPSLTYTNGLDFPFRPTHTYAVHDDYTLLTAEKVKILEHRILDAIDAGFIITADGNKVPLYTENGIDMLGNLIQGNPDSLNKRFYGYLQIYMKMLLGFSGKPVSHFKLHPSVLEHYSTAMRDPIFYSIYKKIVYYFLQYKKNLPSYTYTDLHYPGIKIDNVVVDKLVTYFDFFDIELNNAIYTDFTKDTDMPHVLVKARQMRLNHKPFFYRVNVLSDKATKVAVRVFLGPKFDEMGHRIDINENRVNFVELDKFVYDIKAGTNMIERNSRQFYHTVQDRTSYYTLYKKVMTSLQGGEQFILDQSEAHCGFPNRLILPKGTKGGMPFQLFFMITPYQQGYDETTFPEYEYSCGVGHGAHHIDNLPLGYPLDRKIDVTHFFTPNMYFQDVTIYHKHFDEIKTMV